MSREFNANLGPLVFNLEWRLTLLTLTLLPILASLGFWQLDRAEEKRELALRHARQTALPPMSMADLPLLVWNAARSNENGRDPDTGSSSSFGSVTSNYADRAVSFSARFAAGRYLLLDNRIRDGRFGYELIALVESDNALVPLNLGWIPGDPARQSVPAPTLPAIDSVITGRFYVPSDDAYLLAEQVTPDALPAVVQDYPAAKFAGPLSATFGKPVLPMLVRIDSGHPLAKRADWLLMNQSPEKHTGYAVQWFTMSAVLLIAFLWRSSNIGALLLGRRHHTSS